MSEELKLCLEMKNKCKKNKRMTFSGMYLKKHCCQNAAPDSPHVSHDCVFTLKLDIQLKQDSNSMRKQNLIEFGYLIIFIVLEPETKLTFK